MSNKLQFYWNSIVCIGYHNQMDEEERIQLKTLNLQAIYCIFGSFLLLIKSITQGYEDVLTVLIIILLITIIFGLNYFKKLHYTKIYWIILFPLVIFGIVLLYGNKPHGEILFIIPLVNLFILFEQRKIQILLTLFISILCGSALIHNSLYESPLASATDASDSFMAFLITVSCIAIIINSYTKALRHQLQLSETNNQALQDANADLEHFTYMASHNMKTPLRNILGSIFFMKRKMSKTETKEIEEYIDEIKANANDMHTLINDIMEYAVFIQNEMTNVETINFQALCEKITKSVNLSLGKNAVLKYNGHSEIFSNLTLINAILQNLIENGVKYNEAETPIIDVRIVKEKKHYLIKVTDNGIGVSPEYYDKIFIIFKRLHHNDEYEGTGIGLAMCKRLLNKYNGEIWLESEVGKGTTFFVRVPIITQIK